jgi:hypothetical protein
MAEAGIAQGEKLSELSRRLNVGEDALRRHRRHMQPLATDAAGLDEQLNAWTDRLAQLYRIASQNGDTRTMVEVAKSSLAILNQRQQLAAQKAAEETETDANDGRPSLDWIDNVMRSASDEKKYDYTQKCAACGRLGVPNKLIESSVSSPQVVV